jgi:hypothetical protein
LSGRTVGLGYAYLYGCSIQAPEARGERRFVAGGGNDDTVSAEIDGDGLNLLYTDLFPEGNDFTSDALQVLSTVIDADVDDL